MRDGMLTTGEWLHCIYREFDKDKGEAVKVGVKFLAKQTSVADLVAFQTKKGATTEISNPLDGLESSDIKFEIYTTSRLEFEEFGEIDILSGRGKGFTTYTLRSVSEIKDSAYSIKNIRTGRAIFPQVLRLG